MREDLLTKITPDDASDFYDAVTIDVKGSTLNSLAKLTYNPHKHYNISEDLLRNKFYLWVSNNLNFKRVVRYYSQKKLFSENEQLIKITLAQCVATVYPQYHQFTLHPDKLTSTTQESEIQAINRIDKLLDSLNANIHMEHHSDTLKITELLLKMKEELSGDRHTTYSRSNRQNLLKARLVRSMDRFLTIKTEIAPRFAIQELVSIMVDVSEGQVRRLRIQKNTIDSKN